MGAVPRSRGGGRPRPTDLETCVRPVLRCGYRGRVESDERSADRPDDGEVETLLRSRLEEVTSEIAELTRPPERGSGIGFGKRVGDGTTEAITRFTDVGIANGLQEIRARIERALEKLEEGSYGVCDRCGGPIAAGRLRAAPESALCITCASARR